MLLGFIAIMSVSAISPRNKVRHNPFVLTGVQTFAESCFLCFVHKLPSIFLGRLNFVFFGGFELGASLSVELSSLDSVHSPVSNRSWSVSAKVRARSILLPFRHNTPHKQSSYTRVLASSQFKFDNMAMRMEYTDRNDVISLLLKQPPSNEL